MSALKGRRRTADHRHAAEMARQLPGQWVLAGSYNGRQSAAGAAYMVRTGSDALPHYQPSGAFEARTELTQDGADLYVRYIGQPAEGGAVHG